MIGVLVMAYGTPRSPEDIETYYTRIRHGRPPTEEQLADLTRRYAAIGGTSPLAQRTAAQVRAVENELERQAPGRFLVRFGSKYQAPMIQDAVDELLGEGVSAMIGLVLAPHTSSMSTGQYFERARAAIDGRVEFATVGSWWQEPEFVDLLAGRVTAAFDRVPSDRWDTTEVLFSAHSLPERILELGDTYPDQLRESAELVAKKANVAHYDVCWQSAGRTPEPWIGPDILEVIRQKAASGVTDIVSCPIGFTSDHLEVLYDVDIEATGVANEVGVHLVRTASLNDDPELASLLARLVIYLG